MMYWIRIPRDVTVSYKAMAEWKQSVGIPLTNELTPSCIGKSIEVAVFSTEEDLLAFRLRFGL